MSKKGNTQSDDDKAHIITVKDDVIYGYEDVIDKIMYRKKPYIEVLLRRKAFEPGIYRIRDGNTKKLTHDEINIIESEKIMWIHLTNEQAKTILGTDQKPIFKTYLWDLRRYFSRHEMSYMNIPEMYLHQISPIIKPVQEKLF
jgi:hypothetical protein